jgi:hypothetical protein
MAPMKSNVSALSVYFNSHFSSSALTKEVETLPIVAAISECLLFPNKFQVVLHIQFNINQHGALLFEFITVFVCALALWPQFIESSPTPGKRDSPNTSLIADLTEYCLAFSVCTAFSSVTSISTSLPDVRDHLGGISQHEPVGRYDLLV